MKGSVLKVSDKCTLKVDVCRPFGNKNQERGMENLPGASKTSLVQSKTDRGQLWRTDPMQGSEWF